MSESDADILIDCVFLEDFGFQSLELLKSEFFDLGNHFEALGFGHCVSLKDENVFDKFKSRKLSRFFWTPSHCLVGLRSKQFLARRALFETSTIKSDFVDEIGPHLSALMDSNASEFFDLKIALS